MKKLITTKNVELIELKYGGFVEIPEGTELETTSNTNDRIIEFTYNGYNFKVVANEFSGLELVEKKSILVEVKMTYQKTSNEDTQTKKLYGRHGIIMASSEAVNKPKKIEEVEKMENTKIELTGLDAIKEGIKSLRGAEVSIFGQRQVLESEVDEITVDILDIIEKLESFEVDTIEVGQPCEYCHSEGLIQSCDEDGNKIENEFEECEECEGIGIVYNDLNAENALNLIYDFGDLKEIKHDNSYNWNASVSNDFDFKTWKDTSNDRIYVKFKVHRYGDVRSNYTDVAVLEFNHENEFLETLIECNKTIEVDGYNCTISAIGEGIEVYKVDGEYITTVYPCDMKELKKEISELNN